MSKAKAERKIEDQLWLMSVLYPNEQPNFPQPVAVQDFLEVEESAERLRKYWKLGQQTIGCLVEVAESHGVIVVGHSGLERDRQFDGLSGFANGTIPVAVISISASGRSDSKHSGT